MNSDRRNAQFLHGYRSNVLFTLQWDVCVDTHTHTPHTDHTHTHTHTHTKTCTPKQMNTFIFLRQAFVSCLHVAIPQNDAIRCFFFFPPPAAMTPQSIYMSDTYFNTQEPMKRIGQPDRLELKQRFCFEVRFWDWRLSFWEMCDWAVEWGLVCYWNETM